MIFNKCIILYNNNKPFEFFCTKKRRLYAVMQCYVMLDMLFYRMDAHNLNFRLHGSFFLLNRERLSFQYEQNASSFSEFGVS